MSLEGLVSGIGCGVLSEGKAEGIDSTGGARVRHARLRIGGACGHGAVPQCGAGKRGEDGARAKVSQSVLPSENDKRGVMQTLNL